MDMPIVFKQFPKLIAHSIATTNVKPFASHGIHINAVHKTAILRSVDDTPYYDDDLTSVEHPIYTLFGHNGDQSVDEKRYNKKLLDPNVVEHIYLYRVQSTGTNGKSKRWIWYGKYKIKGRMEKEHRGKDGNPRTIILLQLERI